MWDWNGGRDARDCDGCGAYVGERHEPDCDYAESLDETEQPEITTGLDGLYEYIDSWQSDIGDTEATKVAGARPGRQRH